ncbi:MAG: hypothetical protein IJL89_06280 [Firmicutes bacterium]|nr:hypothetical protein [Bacillota bacterium]
MADKNITPVEDVDVSELDKISGGSIDNVNYTKTDDISEDTQNKIK